MKTKYRKCIVCEKKIKIRFEPNRRSYVMTSDEGRCFNLQGSKWFCNECWKEIKRLDYLKNGNTR